MDPERQYEDLGKIDYAELPKTSSLPDDLRIKVSGSFSSETEARELRNTAFEFLKYFGRFLDLEGLDGVTIADDYTAALAEIDRGFQATKAPAPSRDLFGEGCAMSLPVVRDGVLKTHIVLDSRLLRPLLDNEAPLHGVAIHSLCHEAAHSHDHRIQSRAFPGLYATQIPDYRDGLLLNLALLCWGEYIASRLSAPYGTPDYCEEYENVVCPMLETARRRGNEVIDQLLSSGNEPVPTEKLVDVYSVLLIRASYLVGHIHGLNMNFQTSAPRLCDLIQRTEWFRPLFDTYTSTLEDMYGRYGEWSGIEVFEPLKNLFEVLLNAGGMSFQKRPKGKYFIGLCRSSS